MSLKELLSVVNASGFLLQLRVEAEAGDNQSHHGWDIIGAEHPWRLEESGDSGFIDLILRYGTVRLVIECKRPRQGKWVFLVPATGQRPQALNRLRWTHRTEGRPNLAGFHRFSIEPKSHLSSFCVVRGSGEKDQPMLERLVLNLLHSVEALSAQELEAAPRQGLLEDLAVYIPVIVTSAELFTCTFPLENVSLSDGTLPEADFKAVPYIRFEKSFLLESVTERGKKELSELYQEAVATVFIVNAPAFLSFLQECNLLGSRADPHLPWMRLRAEGL